MKIFLLVAASYLLVLSGCASSSGIHRIGDDSFTVTVEASPAKGGRVAAQRMAYDEAGQQSGTKKVERLAEVEPERVWGQTASQLRLDFKCVP